MTAPSTPPSDEEVGKMARAAWASFPWYVKVWATIRHYARKMFRA